MELLMINSSMIFSLMNKQINFIIKEYPHILYQGGFVMESITTLNLEYLKNPHIIDIRTVEKYNNNHIPNSINIPVEKLLSNFTKY